MKQEYLSDIELYYTTNVNGDSLELTGDEFKHIVKVMRHSAGDILYVTDGLGNYYETTITEITKSGVSTRIQNRKKYNNEFKDVYFCFPRLKNNTRFEFELEKSIELGITNILIINTERTIPRGEKLDRWNKIALSAMKQSLRTYLPKIEYENSVKSIKSFSGVKIIFDQKSKTELITYLMEKSKIKEKVYYIFGPEGGLSEKELLFFEESEILRLTQNRLRAETAVVTAASAISLLHN